VRPVVVVLLPPLIDRGLSFLQGGERPGVIEELVLQGLMPAFDLAGRGGRVGPGEQLADAVAAADPLEQDLGRAGLAESSGELLAVVREHFVRDAVGPHRGDEGAADGACGATAHDGGDHAVPGVVVKAGDELQLGAVGQEYRRGDVQLPQLHRRFPLPALVVLTAALSLTGRDQAPADENPVDSRPGRHRCHLAFAELILQSSRSPPRMRTPELADHRLDVRCELTRLEVRPVGMVSQPG
jgi:hypothetical protein